MNMTASEQPPAGTEDASFHRSGAVARMLRMPVATLRVWERRYALTQPRLSPGGQRLYSDVEVRRLALLKKLTDLGHAIGSLAALDMQQLQHVASTHAHAQAVTHKAEHATQAGWLPAQVLRIAVVGAVLGRRLRRPSLLRQLDPSVVLLGPFDDLAQAAAALQGAEVDALLMHEAHLQDGWLASIDAVAPAFTATPKAVLYGFAADAVCEALADVGTVLLREPQPDVVVAQWLRSLPIAGATPRSTLGTFTRSDIEAPPRRWSDEALADFASRSSAIACECPRHLSDLLVQLSHFEAYSADCEHRHAADAQLHAYLRSVAGASRAHLEAALEQVALHEGWALSSPP